MAVDALLDPDAETRALDARFDALERERAMASLRAQAEAAPNDSDAAAASDDDDNALDRLRKRMDDA